MAQVAHPRTGEEMFSMRFVVKRIQLIKFPKAGIFAASAPADFRHALATGRRISLLHEK